MAVAMVALAPGSSGAAHGTNGTLNGGVGITTHDSGGKTIAAGICTRSKDYELRMEFAAATVNVTDSGTSTDRTYTGPVVANLRNASPNPFYAVLTGGQFLPGFYSNDLCSVTTTVTLDSTISGTNAARDTLECGPTTGTLTRLAGVHTLTVAGNDTCEVESGVAGLTTVPIGTSTDSTVTTTYSYQIAPTAQGFSACAAPAIVVLTCAVTGTVTLAG